MTLPHRSRRALLALLAVGGVVLIWLAVKALHRPRPNVLLITIDTLRPDHLGSYGFALARTPHLDRLAREGLRCSDAVTAAPITMPSHATIMTGVLPPAHGVRDNGAYALGEDSLTLAERLREKGYETQAFVSALVLNRRYNLTQGFDGYDDNLWSENQAKLFMVRDRPSRKTAELFLSWLGQWRAKSARRPFFAWLHFYDPHAPYQPPPEFRTLAPTPYDGEIASADDSVGRVIEALRAQGLLDNTLVVVTADHGESLGEHKERTHALFIYDATARVPLILRYPPLFPAGRTYAGPVRTIDIAPTVLAALRVPAVGKKMQGIDLLPAFGGRTAPPDLPQYSESLLSEVGFGMAPLYGVTMGGYKWIRAPRPELYNLVNDPHELHNLYEQDRDRARKLDAELSRLLADSAAIAVAARQSPVEKETAEALEALGYLAPAEARKSMGGMDPKDGIGIYNKLEDARHLAQKKQWSAAERKLRQILSEVPEHQSARQILGLVLMRQGRLAEAREEYLKCLNRDGAQFRVLGMLGKLAMLTGDMDQATGYFERAVADTPGFVEGLADLGLIEELRGHDAQAQAWYQKAVAQDGQFPTVHRRLGDLSYERGDYAKALLFYKKTLEITRNDFRAMIQAGNCARRVGQNEQAADYFRSAEKLRPRSWIPAYNLACLYAIGGDVKAAREALDRALATGRVEATQLEQDPDLASLRALPDFPELLKKAKRPVASDDDEGDGEDSEE